MDVNRTSFYPLLLDIIHDLSRAHFVAIDLELSGVPVKQQQRSGQKSGRPSLQERYSETKAAAEKFHILQFGLTCVHEDTESGKYVCKPYNIDLSPLLDDIGLNIEREFTFSTGAVSFLHGVDFDFRKPFYDGVQYLSKQEANLAKDNFDARQNRDAIADMNIKDTDVEALALMQTTREAVKKWLKRSKAKNSDFLNIGPPGFASVVDDDSSAPEFNRFEKRLVHQLIRAEFPKLISYSKRGFIQIKHLDERYEAERLKDEMAKNAARVAKQKGFRWVIEAMLGEDISTLNLDLAAFDPITGAAICIDKGDFQGRFSSATYRLRGRPRVLVGHNCFLDLVYMYHHFVGELPEKVEDFTNLLHAQWPMIIDTKYMATHNCGDINPHSSLEDIAHSLQRSSKENAMDIIDEEHNKYNEEEHFHEAGFDSLLTAQIAIRLSRKLEAEQAYLDEISNDFGGVSLIDSSSSVVDKTKSAVNAALSSFGLIKSDENLTPNHDFIPADPKAKWKRTGKTSLGPAKPGDPFAYNPGEKFIRYEPTLVEVQGIKGGMPRFEDPFWKVYGNKLRIFGTDESLLKLD